MSIPTVKTTKTTVVRDYGYRRLVKTLNSLQRQGNNIGVDVGFFEDAKTSDGTSIAEYMTYNETGTENEDGTELIPARPFMSTTVDKNSDKYKRAEERLLARVAAGGMNIVGVYATLGEMIRADIVKAIRNWTQPPNAESTQRAKGKNDPLHETGAAMNNVEKRVVMK